MSSVPAPQEPRTGTFLFREAGPAAVQQAIEALGAAARPYASAAGSVFWVYPAQGEPLLRLHLIQSIAEYEIDLTLEAYQQWWLPLKAALGAEPSCALWVELSQGEAAAQVMSKFAEALLARHAGLFQETPARPV